MKCAIITFTYGDNYGQRLQNLAMQELLKKYFSEVYTIKQLLPRISIKQKIKMLFDLDKTLKKNRHNNFENFDREHISFYSKPISEKNSSEFPEEEFDFFVVGSDQVWSPFSYDVNSTMFLTFASPEKRIAISPSLSCEYIPYDKLELFSKYFNGIKYISTREYQGSELVSNIIGKNVPTLLDPTLMFDDVFWDEYLKQVNFTIPDNYCFCYCLGARNDFKDVQELCNKMNLHLINIMAEKKYYALGPGEFLYLIKNSKLVITDSYHGTIFSYIFRVPFLNIKRKGTGVDMNSRFDTLYRKMSILPRFLEEIEESEIYKLNFCYINKNIEAEKEQINNFICNIIK